MARPDTSGSRFPMHGGSSSAHGSPSRKSESRKSNFRNFAEHKSAQRDIEPHKSEPHNFAPQKNTPHNFAPQKNTPHSFAPQKNTPHSFAPQKNTPHSFAPRNPGHIDILYEDDWIIAINKPEGLLTVSYPGFHGKTALDILTEIRQKAGNPRPAVVHRLDRDTSGVMLFAASAEAKKRLMDTWQTSVTERSYIALVENNCKKTLPETGTINAPLAYNKYNIAFVPLPGTAPAKDAVTAVTHYTVMQTGAKYSLLCFNLETGRKNQIRAHAAYIGFPIAGDDNGRAHTDPLGRLCLHARSITVTHPKTGTPLHFEVPEPASWKKLCTAKKR